MSEQFRGAAVERSGGGWTVTLPFDPTAIWGARDQYHVHGTVAGHPFRGALIGSGASWHLQLGPAWWRAPAFSSGDVVEVVIGLEGPQSASVSGDIAAAFAAEPAAARFFDSMPSFYRKNQVRWIEGAKRPETRAKRIAETIDLASQGKRERG